jgi:hypothetical protein
MNDTLISVVLATYNMSAALKLAIESVLYQTHRNFELLVVGDHCTDDSEAVVNAIGDPRIRWFNLPQNAGHQWMPNNLGLTVADGELIAYQGHDDIWAPTHLERAIEALTEFDADIAVNMCLFYGPPESKVRAVFGLFPDNQYSPRYAFPPASMLHKRSLVDRVGMWRPPHETSAPPDVDFVTRCHKAGAKIVSTHAPTLFKFSTTYRRNSYQRRDVTELEKTLAALRNDEHSFVTSELIAIAQCAIEDRLTRFERNGQAEDMVQVTADWRRFKGSHSQTAPLPKLGKEPIRFLLEEGFSGFEWHPPEHDPVHGSFRWSGPSTMSTIPLPVRIAAPTRLRMHVVHVIEPEILDAIALTFNGRPLDVTKSRSDSGRWFVDTILDPQPDDLDPHLSLTVPRTARPLDLSGSADRRWLGLALNWIELSPVD